MTSRRITVVTSEVLGVPGTGGPGTADSLLAIALGRRGHQVELAVAPGRDVSRLNSNWERAFAQANVRVHPLALHRPVRPAFLAPAWHVYNALQDDPPEVVVADDWRAVAYAALRSRQLARSLAKTAFVLYCHGPARVFAAAARKVPDTVARFGEEIAQRACLDLADAVVTPSEWLMTWLRDHGWPLHEPAHVIQNLWESVALGKIVSPSPVGTRIRRLAFFGQLREGKGIRVFLESLRKVDPSLLEGVDLLFLGHTRSWTDEQIRDHLGQAVVDRVGSIRLETQLDRTGAIDELRSPGTLAVMPSLLENSPYAVAECIEHGVPFLAADVGGTPELLAQEDRVRVLLQPTPDAFGAAVARALASPAGVQPAKPAHAPDESLAAWLDLIETVAPLPRSVGASATRVAVVACGTESVERAERLAKHTRSVAVDVVAAESRGSGLSQATADWVLFLDEDDIPDDGLLDALMLGQAASGADAVTTAVRAPDGLQVQLFLGDPGPVGLIENQYGVIGVIRRSLAAADPDWLLFARPAVSGAQIVSIPDPLSVHLGRPAAVGDSSGEGLAVLGVFERARPEALQRLPQLTATLGAALTRLQTEAHQDGVRSGRLGVIVRGLRRARHRFG
jgi:glycosyltransferase involved in cell wall biosynthesis